MNELMKLVLSHRGLTEDDLQAFENPDHKDLQGLDRLMDRLLDIHDGHRKIVVLPDFDMDGIMSGVVGYVGLFELGFDVELFCPNPAEGYGFGKKQIDRLMAEHPGVQAIISCDCGISCLGGARYAIDNGIEVLITDHHIESADTSPRAIASAVVDPCAIGEEYEHPGICGAHVFWQCLDRYAHLHATPDVIERIRRLRVFAGVGTISDVMPVLYENRVLIRDALTILHETWECSDAFTKTLDGACEAYKQAFRGLYVACKVFSEQGKLDDPAVADEEFFGFYLAPTFNAVKRMDGDMRCAFGVFTDSSRAADMEYLFDLNEQRKKLVEEKMAEIAVQDNPLAPFCYVSDAQKGILGLLATKMMQSTGMPCVVVRENKDGSYAGSGRSPEWFPFVSFAGAGGYRVAGHEGAFGCGFDDRAQLEALCADVSEAVGEFEAAAVSPEEVVDFVIAVDGTGDVGIEPSKFIEFVGCLDEYRPFGKGFEAPTALLKLDGSKVGWQVIGADRNHLKITMPEGLDVLCWNQASILDGGIPSGEVQVVGSLGINEFRGNVSAQFVGDVVSVEGTPGAS